MTDYNFVNVVREVFRSVIFVLFIILIFQIGTMNGMEIKDTIKKYCTNEINFSTDVTGSVLVLYHNPEPMNSSHVFVPTYNKNIGEVSG